LRTTDLCSPNTIGGKQNNSDFNETFKRKLNIFFRENWKVEKIEIERYRKERSTLNERESKKNEKMGKKNKIGKKEAGKRRPRVNKLPLNRALRSVVIVSL